jgi:hypothetical protein
MINGGTLVARIIAVWLLILVLSIGLLFGISSALGGTDSDAALAITLCLVIIVQVSLILAIVIIFAYGEFKKKNN